MDSRGHLPILLRSILRNQSSTRTKTDICTMTEFPFTVTEHIVDTQYIREYPHATTVPDAPLKLFVKKYTPVDNPNPQPGDVTLIGAPGTGYPKVSPIFNAMTI